MTGVNRPPVFKFVTSRPVRVLPDNFNHVIDVTLDKYASRVNVTDANQIDQFAVVIDDAGKRTFLCDAKPAVAIETLVDELI